MCIAGFLWWDKCWFKNFSSWRKNAALSEVKNWNKVNPLEVTAHSNMEICKFGLFKHFYMFGHDSFKKL